MRSTITVGTDGSTAATEAVMWAAATADRTNCDLTIIHACELPVPAYVPFGVSTTAYQLDVPQMIAAGLQLVHQAQTMVAERFPNLATRVVVERGEVGQLLVDLSKDAKLLVVAAHEPHLLTDLILGSHARFVLHHSTTNVAVIPYAGETSGPLNIRRIVVGVDGSASADRALEWACDEANAWNAAVVALHTWQFPYFENNDGELATVAFQHRAARELAEVVERLRTRRPDLANVPVEEVLVVGSPSRGLLGAAETADLLVVGNRGRGGFRSMLLGSVSHHVAQHSAVPVVVVHTPNDD